MSEENCEDFAHFMGNDTISDTIEVLWVTSNYAHYEFARAVSDRCGGLVGNAMAQYTGPNCLAVNCSVFNRNNTDPGGRPETGGNRTRGNETQDGGGRRLGQDSNEREEEAFR